MSRLRLAFLIGSLFALIETANAESVWDACPIPTEIDLLELADSVDAITVGERHGTTEMPAAFADIVEQVAVEGRRVTVALEYPRGKQAFLDSVMDAEIEEVAADLLAEYRIGDGRTSEAMQDMVLSLRRLKQSGAMIDVAAVDFWSFYHPDDNGSVPDWIPSYIKPENTLRDVRMGQGAVAACERYECDLLLYFAGGLHTGLKVIESGMLDMRTGAVDEFDVVSAGRVISESIDTAAISLVHRGGTSRAIVDTGPGVQTLAPNAPDYVVRDFFPYCLSKSKTNHTHIMSVGTVTGSLDTYEPD